MTDYEFPDDEVAAWYTEAERERLLAAHNAGDSDKEGKP